MLGRFGCLLLILAVGCAGSAPSETSASGTGQNQPVAFVDVSVIPMDRERVLEHQTVLVRDGKIAAVGPVASVAVPNDAKRIDGKGKFLVPGLAEMHGHLPSPNQSEAVTEAFLKLFVANGVTTVRGMFGFPNHVALRERIAKGELLGPTLYVASPALSGQSVQTEETAERLVREYKQAGFDLLKVHEGLSPAVYAKIVETAGREKIPFGGHVADSVGIEKAFAAGQDSIDHLDGYLEALEADDSPIKGASPEKRAAELYRHLDEAKIAGLAEKARASGTWNVPTMALWETFFSSQSSAEYQKRPELKYVPANMVAQWTKQKDAQLQQLPSPEAGDRVIEIRRKMLKALSDAGANIMLGSDAPQLFSVPGFSLHREVEVMAEAGMTPYQILVSGTKNPARYLGDQGVFGTVEPGRRADLILLEANPLADIGNLWKQAGVMVDGRWLSKDEIGRMLAEVEKLVAR